MTHLMLALAMDGIFIAAIGDDIGHLAKKLINYYYRRA